MASKLQRAKILLFGDSITQQSLSASLCGWGGCIADRYQRRADVLNRGFSGYNSGWFLRFAHTEEGKADLFGHEDVRLVTIFFGANDASDPAICERLHVPLDVFKANIKGIVSLVRSNFGEDVNIILISPPPVCHEGRLKYQKKRYGEKATGKLDVTLELSKKYAECVGSVASELGLAFLDLWEKMQFTSSGLEREGWQHYFSDGVHLSFSGNKFVGESLIELIDSSVPELSVIPCPQSGDINSSSKCTSIKSVGPWHNEIDHLQPERAFGSEEGVGDCQNNSH